MCSARTRYAFFKARQRRCSWGWLKTQHAAAEHRGDHRKQDQRYRAAIPQEQSIHHRPAGDPLRNCTQASDSQLSLAGLVLSRKHGLATFVHERLEWSLVDQSPEQSEIERLCVDVAGHKIIIVYKPPRSRLVMADESSERVHQSPVPQTNVSQTADPHLS